MLELEIEGKLRLSFLAGWQATKLDDEPWYRNGMKSQLRASFSANCAQRSPGFCNPFTTRLPPRCKVSTRHYQSSDMKKILIFTDSRGQHKPAGTAHDIFAERMAKDPRFTVDMFLCPMKWTTTLDFLEQFPPERLAGYDHVILYTGIVEWSPRPAPSARADLYDNATTTNLENLGLNTPDYSKKIVNNKKAIFDRVFGAEAMATHLSRPFETRYEGQPTLNMYSLDMARDRLVPILAAIPNLIFITSNRFVPGWEGDFTKGRPDNIGMTEAYARAFAEALPQDRVIDLQQWDARTVTEFTCDNLHLTKAGSDWIYDEILERIARMDNKAPAPGVLQDLSVDRSADPEALLAYQGLIPSLAATETFLDARRKGPRTVRGVLSEQHADLAYLNAMSFLLGDSLCQDIVAANDDVKSDHDLTALVRRLYSSEDQAKAYILDRFAKYRKRYQDEYWILGLSKLNVFPYNYFSGYSMRAIERTTAPEALSLEFIYCIKNRKHRTTLSLNSLIRAVRHYQSLQNNTLTVKITVVEDVSDDIFDPNQVLPFETIDHYIVDTGVGWTRSGLLNVGIRNSKADLIALVDADFLFHEGYIRALAEYLSLCDWRKQIIASNLIETEAHKKGDRIYSAASPYSYMWMAPRESLREIGGFDEGYTGHGSEDRDLELKLIRLCGLTVADTASIVPDCAVLHLSHNSRDGYDQHQVNRKRYLERMAADPQSLRQARWGEQTVVWAVRSSCAASVNAKALALNAPLAPRRYGTRSLSFAARGHSSTRTLYMIISCAAYTERQALLERYYRASMPPNDNYVFIVGGAKRNSYNPATRTLYLAVGDFYEDLPEKVLQAIAFCTENFDFSHLVKVDDDVIVNFPLLTHLVKEFGADYFGKMIPSRRGAKPSPTWHIGKVSERSPYFDKPFSFEGGPANWCCGGMYAMTRKAAQVVSRISDSIDAPEYLYEDHMIGCLLDQKGIAPVFIEEHPTLNANKFIQTDLRDILDDGFNAIRDTAFAENVGGVHCGPFPPLYPVPRDKCLALMELFIAHYNIKSKETAKEHV